MTHIDKHHPGSFCWVELATSDQAAAKSFYGTLFGWTYRDSPMAPGEMYTVFQIEGRDAAAAYTLREDQKAAHVPPNWLVYVQVGSADATAARTKELGGNVVAGPFDVGENGRMAVLQDPTGAYFAVWQVKTHHGIGITGVDGTLSWADLNTPDPKRASHFYSELFGWHMVTDDEDLEHDYIHIKNGEHFIGGIPPTHDRDPNVPPHWLVYFHTSNCDASANKAKQGGAKLWFEPMTMENVGRFTVLADPQGATFAIFQPIPRSAK